jgi:hypothetical protein
MPEATARAPRATIERAPARKRRTVTITGHPDRLPPPRRPDTIVRADPRRGAIASARPGALAERMPRLVEIQRRRPPRSARERLGPRPDRLAMWALLMAVVIVVVALLSSHAAG